MRGRYAIWFPWCLFPFWIKKEIANRESFNLDFFSPSFLLKHDVPLILEENCPDAVQYEDKPGLRSNASHLPCMLINLCLGTLWTVHMSKDNLLLPHAHVVEEKSAHRCAGWKHHVKQTIPSLLYSPGFCSPCGRNFLSQWLYDSLCANNLEWMNVSNSSGVLTHY